MKPSLFIILLALSCDIGVAVACAFCALQPNEVAAYVRRKRLSSPTWLRNWPFAGIVIKEWYPVYLRVMGIGGFVFAVVWLTLLSRLFSK
jgi:hypothetical protein